MNQLATTMIIGAGEEVFCNLLEQKNMKKLDIILGNKPNINILPLSQWNLLDMETYLKNPFWGAKTGNSTGSYTFTDYMKDHDLPYNKTVDLLASRGCPFKCNFCTQLCSYQQRSIDHVIMEILALKAIYKPDFYGFIDNNMMANKSWLTSFCTYLINHNIDIKWGCMGRVDNASPALLDLMHDSGCRFIGYGIESASQKILDLMNKRTTVKQSETAIRNTSNAEIYTHTYFIFGYPGETKETINETIRFRKYFNIDVPAFFATPYPGTKLFKDNEEKIYKKFGNLENFVFELEDAGKPVINLTDFNDSEWISYKKKYDRNEEIE